MLQAEEALGVGLVIEGHRGQVEGVFVCTRPRTVQINDELGAAAECALFRLGSKLPPVLGRDVLIAEALVRIAQEHFDLVHAALEIADGRAEVAGDVAELAYG